MTGQNGPETGLKIAPERAPKKADFPLFSGVIILQCTDGKSRVRSRILSPEKKPERTADILRRVLRNMGLEGRMDWARLRTEWADVVGETVASRCRPGEVRGGILFILVENNVWMQEIAFHRETIIRRIRDRFPGLGVREIRMLIERERSEG
ncbi:MAG TPA: DUF721 domain-containing protein [Candidatus Krumholzibacterium sp.]|nr:DUF721 domain-containing protein [Candidatus Krumholzibacterium sp.]